MKKNYALFDAVCVCVSIYIFIYLFKLIGVDDERVLEPCQAILNSTSSSIKGDKLPRNLPNLNKVGAVKNLKSKIAVHDKAEELELSHGRGKPNLMQSSQMEMDVNQVTQSAPDSPPFCDTKGSDNDCSDQDSEHVKKHTLFYGFLFIHS